MKVHLIDGTYELFRAYYGAPPRNSPEGIEMGATLAFSRTLMVLLRQKDSSHLACAFDHTVESFRNDLFAGYKTGEGIEPDLLGQFSLVERAASALGIVVWPMVEFEADDALATGALRFSSEPEVEQVVVCSPDKDLAQCVQGSHVVCLDRRKDRILDEKGVFEKFGVLPDSIPDWLSLVGDSADGIPGVPRWGPKSSSRILERYRHLEEIPIKASAWEVKLRGAHSLAESLKAHREEVILYRTLATLRTNVPLKENLDDLKWEGVRGDQMEALAQELGVPRLLTEAARLTPDP
ncbi:MAG: 5'-3' exonuclease H3TH domain-containing protein [Acidobacteriota bacterium]|nr:5'-3' exonuclease H3TH domain-containing protein [Acidobacteriota bacterium]